MKVILVDAVNALVVGGQLFRQMHELLETFPSRKIVLTNANDEEFVKFGLNRVPYEVFTLKHNPDKTDPEYYMKMLAHFRLSKTDVVYFEHNPAAVSSAQSVGIRTMRYDPEKKDLAGLRHFLEKEMRGN